MGPFLSHTKHVLKNFNHGVKLITTEARILSRVWGHVQTTWTIVGERRLLFDSYSVKMSMERTRRAGGEVKITLN